MWVLVFLFLLMLIAAACNQHMVDAASRREAPMLIRAIVIPLLIAMNCGGCGASLDEMRAAAVSYQLPFKPTGKLGILYVARPSGLVSSQSFKVRIDNGEKELDLGITHGGTFLYARLAPGNYRVISSALNQNEIDVRVEAGEATYVEQYPSAGFFKATAYLKRLDEVEGKYALSKCKRGSVHNNEYGSTPAEAPPASFPSGCTKDTDCKGDRVCEKGICVSPAPTPGQK